MGISLTKNGIGAEKPNAPVWSNAMSFLQRALANVKKRTSSVPKTRDDHESTITLSLTVRSDADLASLGNDSFSESCMLAIVAAAANKVSDNVDDPDEIAKVLNASAKYYKNGILAAYENAYQGARQMNPSLFREIANSVKNKSKSNPLK